MDPSIVIRLCPPTSLQKFVRESVDVHNGNFDLGLLEQLPMPTQRIRDGFAHVLFRRRRRVIHDVDALRQFWRVPVQGASVVFRVS